MRERVNLRQQESEHIFEVDLDDFDQRVIQASHERPILVDFWAHWCGPCLVIEPHLKQAVSELGGRVALAKVEVDEGENMKLAGRYRVRGFPTLILFQDGEEKARFMSAQPIRYIREFIRQHARF